MKKTVGLLVLGNSLGLIHFPFGELSGKFNKNLVGLCEYKSLLIYFFNNVSSRHGIDEVFSCFRVP